MPALRPRELVDAVLDAIEQSGESAVLISAVGRHPRKLIVTGPTGATVLWVYVWTLTFGGRPSLPNEYRVQMTGVEPPLEINPDGLTVLVGYEPNLKMFGGFDLDRHQHFTPGSPSVQIDIIALRQALQDGLAFHRKAGNEIAIGVRPDQFMVYARNAIDLHRSARDRETFEALTRASSRQVLRPVDIKGLSAKRQRIVQAVSRLSRSANFHQQVLNGYDHRCAVTRMQLRLLDAAHILPVKAPGSADHILNGIALSPTYHRALDNGLIYLTEDYVMKINPEKEAALKKMERDGGIQTFKTPLGRIHLPADERQWPDPRFIRKANRYRRIAAA